MIEDFILRNETIIAIWIGAVGGLFIGYWMILLYEWISRKARSLWKKYKWWRLPEEEKERRRRLLRLYRPNSFPINTIMDQFSNDPGEPEYKWKEDN